MNIFAFKPLIPNQKWVSPPHLFSNKARSHFLEFLANGYYDKVEEGLIVIEISHSDYRYIGLIGAVDLQDYVEGKLMRHENILFAQLKNSTELLVQRKAMIKPAVLTYAPNQKLDHLLNGYVQNKNSILELDFEDSNEKRKFWLINKQDENFTRIQKVFNEDVTGAYIADGHHRFAAASWLYEKRNYPPTILCSLFSFDQMDIFDFNRVVNKPSDLSSTQLIAALSKYVHIKAIDQGRKPERKFEISMKLGDNWYQLKWRTKLLESLRKKQSVLFDAQLINEYIFRTIFGITDVKTDSGVSYFSGRRGLVDIENNVDIGQVAFLLYPINFSELTTVIDEGGLLPPKSTWFEPRMYNGIIVTLWP